MVETADVVVVGAGVNGTSAAFHLAGQGLGRIVVLEKLQLSAGATGKSGALVRAHYTNEAEARLAREGLRYFRNWAELVGGDCGFEPVGLLVIVPPDRLPDLAENVRWQREIGIDTCLISADEARQIDPSLHLEEEVVQVAYEAGAGCVDANAANQALAVAATRLGVEFRLGTEVRAVLHEGARVSGVATSHGVIHSPCVVVAAGAGSDRLFAPLGVDLGLRPALARITVFPWTLARSRGHPTYLDHVNEAWFRPVGGAATLVGSEKAVERLPDLEGWSESVPTEFIARCREVLERRFPAMTNAGTRGSWACVFMMSPDSRPIVGALPQYPGLFTIAGDSGTSFKTAPAIGRCLSELIAFGRASTVDISPFRPTRFAEGCPLSDSRGYGVAQPTVSR